MPHGSRIVHRQANRHLQIKTIFYLFSHIFPLLNLSSTKKLAAYQLLPQASVAVAKKGMKILSTLHSLWFIRYAQRVTSIAGERRSFVYHRQCHVIAVDAHNSNSLLMNLQHQPFGLFRPLVEHVDKHCYNKIHWGEVIVVHQHFVVLWVVSEYSCPFLGRTLLFCHYIVLLGGSLLQS